MHQPQINGQITKEKFDLFLSQDDGKCPRLSIPWTNNRVKPLKKRVDSLKVLHYGWLRDAKSQTFAIIEIKIRIQI